jgi:hypothetical protein
MIIHGYNIRDEVVDRFESTTCWLIISGYEHFSARAILDKLRWEFALQGQKGVGNEASVVLSRWFEEKYPDAKGFFTKRDAWVDGSIEETKRLMAEREASEQQVLLL